MKLGLLLLILVQSLGFAQEQETFQYYDGCALHMRNEGHGIKETEVIQEYFYPAEIENPVIGFQRLSYLTRTLIRDIYEDFSGAVNPLSRSEVQGMLGYYDDFKIFKVELSYSAAPVKELIVASYGVGGGNGGYIFYEGEEFGDLKRVGHTFDGDVYDCDSAYLEN